MEALSLPADKLINFIRPIAKASKYKIYLIILIQNSVVNESYDKQQYAVSDLSKTYYYIFDERLIGLL